MRRLLSAAVLLLLVAAAPASAATVKVGVHDPQDFRPDVGPFSRMRFDAAPGERNRLTVFSGRGKGSLRFVDPGAPLRAGRRCRSLGPHAAECRFDTGDFEHLFVARLGDRDDHFRNRARPSIGFEVYGEAGPDRLTGGAPFDILIGGSGADRIRGGAGEDLLQGGSGRDQLAGGAGADHVFDGLGRDRVRGGAGDDVLSSTDTSAPVADRFRGGPCRDVLSYGARRERVTGTIGATSGAPGEHDRMTAVEGLRGGGGDDVLRGTEGRDDLEGGSGEDRIYGGAGADRLAPGSGRHDRVFAGPSADRIRPGGSYARPEADVHCGAGRDTSTIDSRRTLLEPDCERIALGASVTASAQPLRVTADTVVMEVPCATINRPAWFQVRLITPPEASPFSRRPPRVTVAEGVRRFADDEPAVCRARLRRSSGATGPVRVVFRYSPNWMFRLPGPA